MISLSLAFEGTQRLIGVALTLQTLELLWLHPTFTKSGIWQWSTLKDEFKIFSKPIQALFNILLNDQMFLVLLVTRLLLGVGLILNPWDVTSPAALPVHGTLFLISILTVVRWRGTFNGGSDYMTLIVLMALTGADLLSLTSMGMDAPRFALGYIGLQSCLSYWVAGWVKLKNPEWRSGKALFSFAKVPGYNPPTKILLILQNPRKAKILAWTLLMFELSFPIVFVHPSLAVLGCTIAVFFHLANVYVFGLNRFLFAWLASYPSLLWVSQNYSLL